MTLRFFGIISIVFAILISGCGEKPDVIFTNGKIYTMNGSNSVVEAMAVKQGKILALGSSKEIGDKYSSEDVVDLNGKVVLPGFIDSDGSIIEFSKNLNYINFSFIKTADEIRQLLLDKQKIVNEGEWIGGYGLNIPIEEMDKLDKTFLDKIAPNYNVFIVNVTWDIAWVNSRLMRTIKVDRNTQSPANGDIEKDENGEPNGIFFDEAVNIIKDNMPGLLKLDMIKQVSKGVTEILKYGITEVHDRTVNKEGIEIFKEMIDSSIFPLRVYAILSAEDSALVESYLSKGAEINYKDKLTVRSISLDYDGMFETQDAVMTDEYKNEPKRKLPYATRDKLEKYYSRAIDKNFQFCIKAVGDRAVDSSLNVIEFINKQKNPKDNRTIIEYCEFLNPKDLNKISELKVIPSVRPDVCMNDLQIVSQLINQDNAKKIGLWNSIIKSAGMLTTGSDFPFNQINPFLQIYYLTTRQPVDSASSGITNPDQKISLLDAIKSYTVWAAYSSFEESAKGSLEVGKLADMIVISNDIFNSDSKELLNTKVLKTIINGRIVYDSKFDVAPAGK